MSDKPLIWRIVLAIVVAGVLVAAGFWVYQWGYRNGVVAGSVGEGFSPRAFGDFGFFFDGDDDMPKSFQGRGGFFRSEDGDFVMPFHQRSDYPFNNFSQRFHTQDRFPVTSIFFSPLSTLLRFVVYGVFLWLIYKVITMFTRGKGWQLSFTTIEDGDEKGKKK